MAAKIGWSLSSSPSSPFPRNSNAKLRLSQFVNQQSVAHLSYDKDKSYRYIHGVSELRARFQKPQTALLGSEDKSKISGLQTAVLVLRNYDSNPKNIFPVGISSCHLSGNDGKPGLVTFYNRPSNRDNEVSSSNSERIRKRISWFLGPGVLVFSFIYPPLFLPQIILRVFGDSPLTVFLLIFFTEAIFYFGVVVFLLLLNHLMRLKQPDPSANNSDILSLPMEKQITSDTLVLRQLSITIPTVSMGLAWPWTGFVVPATLAPYLVGIFVQFTFERFARCWKSPSWAAIPFIFHLYRLQQIHRAANLLTFLSYQARGVEMLYNKLPSTSSLKMPSTSTLLSLPSNSTLQSLSHVLFLLLVICIWSFSSFLMTFLSSASATMQ